MEFDVLCKNLAQSINLLLKNDKDLLEIDINERTLSGRLAIYLEEYFSSKYNVDCEYNRMGDDIKRLPASEHTTTNDTNGKTIFPDIIIHRRKINDDNLCIIEIKKEGNNDTERDIEKLNELTKESGNFSYQYGFHLTFNKEKLSDFEVYQNSKKMPDLKETLAKMLASQ